MKKFAMPMVCTLAVVGFVVADEFNASITKVEGNKNTFLKGKKGDDQKEGSAEVASNVKVLNGMFEKSDAGFKVNPGDAIEGGLKNEMFTKIGEKGVSAQITTDDKGKVTQILAVQFKGGFGKKKDK